MIHMINVVNKDSLACGACHQVDNQKDVDTCLVWHVGRVRAVWVCASCADKGADYVQGRVHGHGWDTITEWEMELIGLQ